MLAMMVLLFFAIFGRLLVFSLKVGWGIFKIFAYLVLLPAIVLMLAKIKKSNLENYGNENGGTPEFFYKKYGSWETVIEKALSVNAGADACLGLYDKYYDTYFVSPTDTAKSNAQKADNPLKNISDSSNKYTVKPGDTLSSIAADILGDKAKWGVIYDINKALITDPNKIYAGQVLTVLQERIQAK